MTPPAEQPCSEQRHPTEPPQAPAPGNLVVRQSFLERHERWFVPLLLLGLCVVAYPRVFFLGEVISPAGQIYWYPPWNQLLPKDVNLRTNIVLSDEMDSTIPLLGYARERLLKGDIPAWCDKVQNGTPALWVVRHILNFEPLMLLVLLLGVPWGMTVCMLLRQILGGLFLYKYTRTIGIGRWASLCAMVVFEYGSFPLQTFGRALSFQVALIPITIYAMEQIIRRRSLLWCAILPFLLHFNVTAGFPAGTLYCFYFLALYGLFRLLHEPGHRLRLLGIFAGLGAIALLMSAPVLIATSDFFSTFDWGYRAQYWRMFIRPQALVTFFYPFSFGTPALRVPPWFWWYEHCIYIGVLPILVLLLSLPYFRSTRIRWFYIIFGLWLAALLYNAGDILERFIQYVPVLNQNPNTRQKLLFFFVLTILFAFAMDDLARRWGNVRARKAMTFLMVPIVGAVVWFLVQHHRGGGELADLVRTHLVVQSVIIGLSIATVVLLRWKRVHPRRFKIVVLLLICFDLQVMDKSSVGLQSNKKRTLAKHISRAFNPAKMTGWNSTLDPDLFFPRTPGVDVLDANLGEHKMLAMERTFLANTPLYFGLNNIAGRGFFDTRLKAVYRLFADDAFRGHPTQFLFRASSLTHLESRFLDTLGIKYVLLSPGQSLDDLARVILIQQKEWNHSIELKAAGRLCQTFKADKDLAADAFQWRIAKWGLSKAEVVVLEIHDLTGDQVKQFENAQWQPATGTLDFDLGGLAFFKGHHYEIRLSIADTAEGELVLLCARTVDMIRSGALLVNGESTGADLTFRILRDLREPATLDQSEWNNRVVLGPGEFVAQSFRPRSTANIDCCRVRVSDSSLGDTSRVHMTLRNTTSDQEAASADGRWLPNEGCLRFDFDPVSILAGETYELSFSVPGDVEGQLHLFCTKDVDLIPEGCLWVNGERRNGDMTLSLFSRSGFNLDKYRTVYKKEFTIFENTAVFDRAWLVGGIRYASDEEIFSGIKGDEEDLRACAWVDPRDREIAGEPRAAATVNGQVVSSVLRSSYQQFDVEAGRDCYLIVSDNYHRNWHATIDEQPVDIFRADYNLRGIRVPRGKHTVEFRYRPPHLLLGIVVAISSTLAIVGLTTVLAYRRRSEPRASTSG